MGQSFDRLVRSSLEGSGIFGAQFRENAGRALLLPRGMPGKRMPLWMTSLRASKLFEAVRDSPDFPVVVETWRSCLGDLFDLDGAKAPRADLADGPRGDLGLLEPGALSLRPRGPVEGDRATTCTGATSSRAGPPPRFRTEW